MSSEYVGSGEGETSVEADDGVGSVVDVDGAGTDSAVRSTSAEAAADADAAALDDGDSAGVDGVDGDGVESGCVVVGFGEAVGLGEAVGFGVLVGFGVGVGSGSATTSAHPRAG